MKLPPDESEDAPVVPDWFPCEGEGCDSDPVGDSEGEGALAAADGSSRREMIGMMVKR